MDGQKVQFTVMHNRSCRSQCKGPMNPGLPLTYIHTYMHTYIQQSTVTICMNGIWYGSKSYMYVYRKV
jgi:hypothetical protein